MSHQQGHPPPGWGAAPTHPAYPTYPQPPSPVPYAGPAGPPPGPHPRARTALALGVVGLAAAVPSVGLSLLVSPVAWVLGQTTLRQVRRSNGWWSGARQARTGMWLGILGSVLLAALVVVLVVVLADRLADGGGPVPLDPSDRDVAV